MKVTVMGLRGLPAVAGGVETHCEHLYPLLADRGVDVEVLMRRPYVGADAPSTWRGLRLRTLWSPRRTGVETVIHTFCGVLRAAATRPDVVHLHAVGSGLFAPLAKAFGLAVVATHHGADYERAKWGPWGRRVLKLGERMMMRHADVVISVSRSKAADLHREYGRLAVTIPNGVPVFDERVADPVIDELGLAPGRYVLHLGRSAPEKRQDDLIRGFAAARLPGWKLVLVGDLGGRDAYSTRVRELAAAHPDVVLAGFRSGDALRALLTQAGCFALPSTIEGFSIALLEALSAGLPSVASDIPANHEIELPPSSYFPVGDVDAMAAALRTAALGGDATTWRALQRRVHAEFGWGRIAELTLAQYEACTKRPAAVTAGARSRSS